MLQAPIELPTSPHVIVVENEKGGSGKTTVAMHIVVALMKAGQRVATIDLDSRQKSLTHYAENRHAWAKRTHTDLELAVHFSIARAEGAKVHENEAAEFADFDKMITAVQHCHFLVIDTPPHDSFLDLDVLAMVDPVTFAVTEVSHYAEMVRKARRLRQSVDGALTDWVVARNRLSLRGACVKPIICESLNELGLRLGFRVTEGFAERAIYRELFPRGLTALDDLEDIMPCTEPDPLSLTIRQEVRALLDSLRLPLDERGRRRAAARAQWSASRDNPLDTHDILGT